ncbi:MAG: transporter substrate-binding domain-containing protein [Motiliproteus sp.]
MKYSGFVLMISFLLVRSVLADQVTLAAEDSWPPFSDQSGNGISKRIATAAFALSDIEIRTLVVPYARALKLTEGGRVDGCWNVTRQQNTESMFYFGNEPLLKADISFVYKTSTPGRFTSISDLPDGLSIGVIIDYEYGDEFEQQKHRFNIYEARGQIQLLKMLDGNRVAVALMFDDVYREVLQKSSYSPQLFHQGVMFYTSDIYIAFNKNSFLSPVYADALDKGLIELRKTGEYQQLLQ